ncbi:translation initiation factor [Helicobacter burdigaliensis]|uniref:translation initiation factor n=1 Tax=Helicobacter burdigaliensis TaxID=2315334 RepID=UPI000EF68A10|nr:translation initiation factor [Helicobacter burdigaliensis]
MDRLNLQIGAKFGDSFDVVCKKCGELQSKCKCKKVAPTKEKSEYFLWINEEKRGGKDLTICGIFYMDKKELEKLLKQCKTTLASGGKIREEKEGFLLEIQGKHKDKLKEILKAQKFIFKK